MCGDGSKKDTPVPMPNTEVKLLSADGRWTFGPVRVGRCHALFNFNHSAIAQLVERMTVNHDVVGSSPTCGVRLNRRVVRVGRRSTIGNRVGIY